MGKSNLKLVFMRITSRSSEIKVWWAHSFSGINLTDVLSSFEICSLAYMVLTLEMIFGQHLKFDKTRNDFVYLGDQYKSVISVNLYSH
jgi:hypothetical protein